MKLFESTWSKKTEEGVGGFWELVIKKIHFENLIQMSLKSKVSYENLCIM